MSKLIADLSMSLDGFVAGPEPSQKDPLGIGGEQLHEWAFTATAWRQEHGLEGGADNADSALVESLRAHRRRDHGPQDVQRRLRRVGGRSEPARLVG